MGSSPCNALPGGVQLGGDHGSRFRATAEILPASKGHLGSFEAFLPKNHMMQTPQNDFEIYSYISNPEF